ncbi:hypothetical protein GE09DRAFT_1220524 [Coniochaeta sp. 2T2.1]|nr:hypothetical protein GE09DRAFT_1220524 [Coniochaeta sp. 2T2.1]
MDSAKIPVARGATEVPATPEVHPLAGCPVAPEATANHETTTTRSRSVSPHTRGPSSQDSDTSSMRRVTREMEESGEMTPEQHKQWQMLRILKIQLGHVAEHTVWFMRDLFLARKKHAEDGGEGTQEYIERLELAAKKLLKHIDENGMERAKEFGLGVCESVLQHELELGRPNGFHFLWECREGVEDWNPYSPGYEPWIERERLSDWGSGSPSCSLAWDADSDDEGLGEDRSVGGGDHTEGPVPKVEEVTGVDAGRAAAAEPEVNADKISAFDVGHSDCEPPLASDTTGN